ncbi:MAG: thioredoxin-disulfide reductase [Clostridia bacterium]|nr:thioredoxin-disulfide reductase [Clostridia bacterium]
MADIIIIGAGTAGITAAIYALRAGKSVIVFEKSVFGGQIIYSESVENYPAIQKISGADFAMNLYSQAVSLGAEFKIESVKEIIDGETKKVITNKGEYEAKAVIIATGVKNRRLEIENENKFIGKGISFCAVCDGSFFKGMTVAVVGGGNTALQDAIYLSNNCEKVYLIHRRDAFRGEKSLVEKVRAKENIELVLNSEVVAIKGEEKLSGITVKNKLSGEEKELSVKGLFEAVGQIPDNGIFENVCELDGQGFIVADEACKTKTDGIFAAGDCRAKEIRQLTTAAADGAISAIKASEYVDNLE